MIVSTEAGSEGVNLQVANVLVNYDLPWNPMIVEQRIGRIQRLASEHASVSILNIILRGTFEEYIVGRLMEKLQMASHAIGDIEALLEASGIDDDEEMARSFDEKILQSGAGGARRQGCREGDAPGRAKHRRGQGQAGSGGSQHQRHAGRHGRRRICRTARAEAAAGRALDGRRANSRWRR